jgi:hypothetical protein
VYTIYNEGRTKRYKTVTDENHRESSRTFYVTPEEAEIVLIITSVGGWVKVVDEVFTAFIRPLNREERIEFKNEPEVGLSPIEFWGPKHFPESIHVGNIIDKIL